MGSQKECGKLINITKDSGDGDQGGVRKDAKTGNEDSTKEEWIIKRNRGKAHNVQEDTTAVLATRSSNLKIVRSVTRL